MESAQPPSSQPRFPSPRLGPVSMLASRAGSSTAINNSHCQNLSQELQQRRKWQPESRDSLNLSCSPHNSITDVRQMNRQVVGERISDSCSLMLSPCEAPRCSHSSLPPSDSYAHFHFSDKGNRFLGVSVTCPGSQSSLTAVLVGFVKTHILIHCPDHHPTSPHRPSHLGNEPAQDCYLPQHS